MVKLYDGGAYLVNGTEIVPESEAAKVESLTGKKANKDEAKKGTIAYGIMEAHNTSGDMDNLKIKFDAMASHDITFVGIIPLQSATIKSPGQTSIPPQITGTFSSPSLSFLQLPQVTLVANSGTPASRHPSKSRNAPQWIDLQKN